MPTEETILIEKNIMYREGIRALLADSKFRVSSSYSDISALDHINSGAGSSALVIAGFSSDSGSCLTDIESMMSKLNNLLPSSTKVIISDKTDTLFIKRCFDHGVDGYILRDASPEVLIASLSLICAGETVCPAAVLDKLVQQNLQSGGYMHSGREQDSYSDYKLSPRELEVLKFLTEGDSNKEIARSLDVTEATIKVHVKSLLRKLDLSNRTQAAVWAVTRGLGYGAVSQELSRAA